MPVNANSPAPYTAATAILGIIRRYREKGLQAPINGDVLGRAGVSPALIPRTLQSLVALDLIDDSGEPTQTFKQLRVVPEAEFKNTLADWLKATYADVFSFVDPATDDAVRVRDAFRTYVPHGQQDRMVSLFLGLCAEAGLAPETPRRGETKPSARKAPAPIPRALLRNTSSKNTPYAPPPPANNLNGGNLPPALSGLLQSIPSAEKGWSKGARDRFMLTFGTVLDFVVPIRTEAEMAAASADIDDLIQ